MFKNDGVSEIIGVILLIGIIVATFSILAAIYVPMVKPTPIPQVKLSMACSNNLGDAANIEYPCTKGSFHCNPDNDPFHNENNCSNECKLRDYSQNPQINPDDIEHEILRCMENCPRPICSDLIDCNYLYICHSGGDTLDVDKIRIIVNEIPIINWQLKKRFQNLRDPTPADTFSIGDTIRIFWDPEPDPPFNPVDKVMITYTLPSGGEITLVLNQFGTDVIR